MYSRYTPNESGGYDRRELPDAADLRAARSRPPPAAPGEHSPAAEPVRAPQTEETPRSGEAGPGQSRPGPRPGSGGRRPLRLRPVPPPPPPTQPPRLGSRPGPGGVLSRLLPYGLDAEDLLVLAVLLLSMIQDGAEPTELLIAAGIYLWM